MIKFWAFDKSVRQQIKSYEEDSYVKWTGSVFSPYHHSGGYIPDSGMRHGHRGVRASASTGGNTSAVPYSYSGTTTAHTDTCSHPNPKLRP